MPRSITISLPVTDVAASMAFSTAIGREPSPPPQQLQRQRRPQVELDNVGAARGEARPLEELAVEQPTGQRLDREPAPERPLEADCRTLVEDENRSSRWISRRIEASGVVESIVRR